MQGARIGFVKTPVWQSKATPALETAWTRGKEILSSHGATVEEVELPDDFAKVPGWHAATVTGDKRSTFLGRKFQLPPIVVVIKGCELIIPFGTQNTLRTKSNYIQSWSHRSKTACSCLAKRIWKHTTAPPD